MHLDKGQSVISAGRTTHKHGAPALHNRIGYDRLACSLAQKHHEAAVAQDLLCIAAK